MPTLCQHSAPGPRPSGSEGEDRPHAQPLPSRLAALPSFPSQASNPPAGNRVWDWRRLNLGVCLDLRIVSGAPGLLVTVLGDLHGCVTQRGGGESARVPGLLRRMAGGCCAEDVKRVGWALDDVQRRTGVWQGFWLNLTSWPHRQGRPQLSRVPPQQQEIGHGEQTEWGQQRPPVPLSPPPSSLALDSSRLSTHQPHRSSKSHVFPSA